MSAFQELTSPYSSRPGMIRAAVPISTPTSTSNKASLTNLTSAFQQQQQEARQAQEKQYSQILRQFRRTKSSVRRKQQQALGSISNLGDTARQRVAGQAQQAQASSQQSLISRGLGNTTVGLTASRGIASDAERAQQAIDEQVGARRSGLLQQQAGQEQSLGRLGIDTTLSRQNVSPDQGAYLQLIQQLASLRV